jgi:hypothetical protein
VNAVAKFLIEVAHEAEKLACARAVQIFLTSGSHFLTHAEWGCADGEHKAWMIVDVDSKDEARNILPPAMRPRAQIVGLNRFSLAEINAMLGHHPR